MKSGISQTVIPSLTRKSAKRYFQAVAGKTLPKSLYKVPTLSAYYSFIFECKKVFNLVFYTLIDNVGPGFCSDSDLTNLVRKQLLSKINLVEP